MTAPQVVSAPARQSRVFQRFDFLPQNRVRDGVFVARADTAWPDFQDPCAYRHFTMNNKSFSANVKASPKLHGLLWPPLTARQRASLPSSEAMRILRWPADRIPPERRPVLAENDALSETRAVA